MFNAQPQEIIDAFTTIISLYNDWYQLPKQVAKKAEKRRCQGKKLTTAHDIYTLFVGEIGIPRREFLYDLQYWETFSIIEGYRKRDRIKLQLLAQVVYSSMYTMRDPQGKKASDLFPQLFEDDEEWDSHQRGGSK